MFSIDRHKYNRFGPKILDEKKFHNPMLKINWNVGNVCTYECSYCAKPCHDGSHPWPSINQALNLVETIDQIYKGPKFQKEKIVFELLGGEVTLWQEIDFLIDKIAETNNLTMLVTNGVRTLDWWRKNARKFGYVTLSFHPERADYKHLTAVSNLLSEQGVGVGILLLMYPPKWDYCLEAFDYFVNQSKAMNIALQPLTLISSSKDGQKLKSEYKEENSPWPYTEEQKQWIIKNSNVDSEQKLKDEDWLLYRLRYLSSDLSLPSLSMAPHKLSASGLNDWYGWNCYIGIDTLFIEQNGNIRREAMCRATPPIANYKSMDLADIQWPENPVRCPHKRCFCIHDFTARKENLVEV